MKKLNKSDFLLSLNDAAAKYCAITNQTDRASRSIDADYKVAADVATSSRLLTDEPILRAIVGIGDRTKNFYPINILTVMRFAEMAWEHIQAQQAQHN
jgi:hypothetical protein